MNGAWSSTALKAQLRTAAANLSQLQDKKDAQAQTTRRDIATLLGHRNVFLARAKAQILLRDEAASELLQSLEQYCDVISERSAELEKSHIGLHPSLVQAIASVVYAAPYTESQALCSVRDTLILRLGPELARSAIHNADGHVSDEVIRLLNARPSAAALDAVLQDSARMFGVEWRGALTEQEKSDGLSEVFDNADASGTLDITRLRTLFSSGIPSHLSWLRPRVWKLLLGVLPDSRARWQSETKQLRDSYYEIVKRTLATVPSLPAPIEPLSAKDRQLQDTFESLLRLPHELLFSLENDPPVFAECPLHESAPEGMRIEFTDCLDERLRLIREAASGASPMGTPEIQLEGPDPHAPTRQTLRTTPQSTLLAATTQGRSRIHPRHLSALVRLLYIHAALNPATPAQHVASLLVPIYVALNQELEASDLAHVEADAFWTFEALLREIAQLDEESGTAWMRKIGERLAVMDAELYENLKRKGLDPALPHYSYRWLASILSQTLPLPAVLLAWDVLLSQPEQTRQSNPKLEHLVNICSAMLLRARARLLQLGKQNQRVPGLWSDDYSVPPRSPLRPWELGDAFIEGLSLLQSYPIVEAGGIERVLQVASDIQTMQQERSSASSEGWTGGLGKLRETMWRGFAARQSTASESSQTEDEDSETESEAPHSRQTSGDHEPSAGWASRLKTTVWRGITNQSAMDDDDGFSPPLTPSPEQSPRRPSTRSVPVEEPSPILEQSPKPASKVWSYAAMLKESNMAATLSKVSTNLTAKAVDTWRSNGTSADGPSAQSSPDAKVQNRLLDVVNGGRRSSLPYLEVQEPYSPPPRPAYFHPPRDSRLFDVQQLPAFPDSPDSARTTRSDSDNRKGADRNPSAHASPSWNPAKLVAPAPKPAKTVPRPLMLTASTSLASASIVQYTRSATSTPTPHQGQWSDVLRNRNRPQHRGSQSSTSSFRSVSSPRTGNNAGWESDASVSRVVPLNRSSISPMAPAFRTRQTSVSSSSDNERVLSRKPSRESPLRATIAKPDSGSALSKGWEMIPIPDSPSTLASPPPRTPTTIGHSSVKVTSSETQRGSVVLGDVGLVVQEQSAVSHKPTRKASVPRTQNVVEDSDSSAAPISPNRVQPRIRSKRYGNRPPNLHVREVQNTTNTPTYGSPNTLMAPDDLSVDIDLAVTPRATAFPSTSPVEQRSPLRSRKISVEEHESRSRKISQGSSASRARKTSTEHRRSESDAHEGDDEGYDELLSAYESEESFHA